MADRPRRWRLAAAALLGALPALLSASPALAGYGGLVPYTAEYKVKISLLSGLLKTDVRATPTGFAARSIITPKGFANLLLNGSIEEYSEFTVDSDGVRPIHYESSDTLSKDKTQMNFNFDYADNVVTGKINDDDFRFEFDGAVHDRVSIQYELMYNLLHNEAGRTYGLLDGDELKELLVTNIGTRQVRVPFGKFEAVGIQHHSAESSRVSILWCVEKLGYLPVVIEQFRDGKLRVRAELTQYVPDGSGR